MNRPPPLNLIILREYFLTLTWVCIFELSYSITSNTSYQYTIICKQKKKLGIPSTVLLNALIYSTWSECFYFAAENVDELDELIIESKDDSKGKFLLREKSYLLDLSFQLPANNTQHFFIHDETLSSFTEILLSVNWSKCAKQFVHWNR